MSVALVLTIVNGEQAGRVLRAARPCRLIIGRDEDSHWKLEDRYVSRHHVLLEICPPACRLRDLGFGGNGSLNIPRVNGRAVRCGELKDGDLLVLGATQIRVSLERVAEPADSLPFEQRRPAGGGYREVHCGSCSADLSRAANSDGRAAELGDRVSYLCEACLAPESLEKRAGDYELRKRLGEGGMGTVYLAYHRATARLVALKMVGDLSDSAAISRFAREARILTRLDHARVVRFVEAGIDRSGAPFLVTEYIAGGNLEQRMERAGPLAPAEAVKLVCQALHGIEYLHGRQVIHRDIKPENILLRPRDGSGTAVVADFGISRYYEEAGGTRLTKPNTRMGTLMFMPPEQVQNAGEAREPADVYSTGATLYYLLTGSYPFDFPSPAQIREFARRARELKNADELVRDILRLERVRHPFRIILEEEPRPLLDRAPHLPRRLAAAIDKSLRKQPSLRFPSAREFRLALTEALVGC